MRLVRLPYHLSSITQATARAALWFADELLAEVEAIKVQRDRIVARRCARLGLAPHRATRTSCSSAGWTTRPPPGGTCSLAASWSGTSRFPGYLRVTAGTEAETTAFLNALKASIKGTA